MNFIENTLEKNLEEKIVDFCKEHEEVLAVTRGFNPEYINPENPEETTYYLIVSNHSKKLYRPIIDFENNIFKSYDKKINLSQRSKPKDNLKDYVSSIPYLGDLIWERI